MDDNQPNTISSATAQYQPPPEPKKEEIPSEPPAQDNPPEPPADNPPPQPNDPTPPPKDESDTPYPKQDLSDEAQKNGNQIMNAAGHLDEHQGSSMVKYFFIFALVAILGSAVFFTYQLVTNIESIPVSQTSSTNTTAEANPFEEEVNPFEYEDTEVGANPFEADTSSNPFDQFDTETTSGEEDINPF